MLADGQLDERAILVNSFRALAPYAIGNHLEQLNRLQHHLKP
jgi:hypothetical protein